MALFDAWFIDDLVLIIIIFLFFSFYFLFSFFGWLFLVFLLLLGLLFVLLLLFLLNSKVDDDIWDIIHSPKLIIVQIWIGEVLNEVDIIVNGDLDKLSQVGVQDIVESGNDSLERALLVDFVVGLEEVMILPELILDFSNKVISPLDHDVLGDG